ncbi:MAG: cytochrome b/b6 domain-containing protein, partial [Acidimicrobiia bacterium]
MAATTTPPEAGALPAGAPIERFDRVERIAHWVNATLFGIVMLTGSILYIGQLSVLFGNREIVRTLHVYCGLAIPVAFLVAYLPRWGRALRTDFSRINRWSKDDKRWFRTLGRDKTVRLGKFNSGQKLNAAFVVASAVVMVATGSIMKWFEPFPDSWRTGATFVHDTTWLVLCIVIAGHILIAFRDYDALRGIVAGWVPESWARREHPRWWAEVAAARADAQAS